MGWCWFNLFSYSSYSLLMMGIYIILLYILSMILLISCSNMMHALIYCNVIFVQSNSCYAYIIMQLLFALLSPTNSHGSGSKAASGGGSGRLAKLCEKVTSGLADCLNYDLILYQESCSDKVWEELGAELPQTPPIINLACFSNEDMLKLSTLSILPSYSLRSLGNPFSIPHLSL